MEHLLQQLQTMRGIQNALAMLVQTFSLWSIAIKMEAEWKQKVFVCCNFTISFNSK